jgi:hypothetical protein
MAIQLLKAVFDPGKVGEGHLFVVHPGQKDTEGLLRVRFADRLHVSGAGQAGKSPVVSKHDRRTIKIVVEGMRVRLLSSAAAGVTHMPDEYTARDRHPLDGKRIRARIGWGRFLSDLRPTFLEPRQAPAVSIGLTAMPEAPERDADSHRLIKG